MSEHKEKPIPFREYVRGVLKEHCGLNTETVDILTDKKGVSVFITAFTNKTASHLNNYEQLEFIGSSIMNDSISLFILNKYPKYTVEWLHRIISSLELSKIGDFLGFWPYIQYKGNKYHVKEKLLEDVLKSFVGALRQIVESKAPVLCGDNPPFGFGTFITHKFIFSVLEEMENKTPDFVSDSWEKVKDPKTRIKELMTKYGLGSISNELKTQEFSNKWESTLKLHNPTPNIRMKTLTSTSFSSKIDAEQDVSRKALSFLLQYKDCSETIPPKTLEDMKQSLEETPPKLSQSSTQQNQPFVYPRPSYHRYVEPLNPDGVASLRG